MTRIFALLIAMSITLFAGVKTMQVTTAIVESPITIIDIRTESEWVQTGIVKGAVPITFFDARGGYDVNAFMGELTKHVSKDKEFALICRTGNRTTAVSDFLGKMGYQVINLKGGIKSLMSQGYVPVKYEPKR